MKRLLISSIFFLAYSFQAMSQVEPGRQRMGAHLCFVENKGQVLDQLGAKRTDIQYKLSASPGLNIFIGNGCLHYQFSCLKNNPRGRRHMLSKTRPAKPGSADMYRLDVTLEGARQGAEAIAGGRQLYHERYPGAKSAQAEVAASFDSITYKDIYPAIDWVLYIKNDHLEYDFMIHPGGNVNDIKIRYNGAEKLEQFNDGIAAVTPLGEIREGRLHCFSQENGAKIASRFELHDNCLRFKVGPHTASLVIDPTLEWATYYGGTDQRGTCLATGDSGFVYMAGYTTSLTNIATTGAYATAFSGADDAFLAKFDSAGEIRWATYYGGSGSDEAYGVFCGRGGIYLSGLTTSADGIATPGAHQSSYGGGVGDAFLAKFSTEGSLIWGTYYGGSSGDISTGICGDTSGNLYIAGYTYSTDSIATPGAYKTTGGGAEYTDGFIAKFSDSGNVLWATYFGGNDDDEPAGIAADKAGNVYMAGATGSTDGIATPGAYQHNFETDVDDDGFIVKFNGRGALQWGTYFGAFGSNALEALVCDGTGNVYVTGSTYCTDSIATPGAGQPALVGSADAYLAKFNSAGAIQWGTYFGGGGDGGNSLAADNAGNIYMAGSTTSISGIATSGAYQGAYGGDGDAFLTRFSSDGALTWASYYGGTDFDEALGAACDVRGNVYITGATKSNTHIATPGETDSQYSASTFGYDAFLAKFDSGQVQMNGVKQVQRLPVVLNLYPNPAIDKITASWQNTLSPARLDVVSAGGLTLYSIDLPFFRSNAEIPLSGLPAGEYTCVLRCGGARYDKKFVVCR